LFLRNWVHASAKPGAVGLW